MAAPFDIEISGQADANGNLTLSKVCSAPYWTQVYFSGQVAGGGDWTMGKASTAYLFEQGANIVMGPLYIEPGKPAQVQLVAATPGAQVTGVFWGMRSSSGSDPSDITAAPPAVATAGSLALSSPVTIGGNVPVVNAPGTQLQTTQPQVSLSNFICTPGGNASKTVTLPDASIHALGLGFSQNAGAVTDVQIVGVTTGIEYSPISAGTTNGVSTLLAPVFSDLDSQLTITVTQAAGSPAAVCWISAIRDVEAVAALLQDQQVGLVDPSLDAVWTDLGVFGSSRGSPQGLKASLLVSHQNAVAAAWQAASKGTAVPAGFSLGANGSHVIVPGVVNQVITIHALDWIEAVSSSVNVFEDTTSAQTVAIDVPASRGGSNTAFIEGHVDGKSLALPSGAGFQMRNTNGVATGSVFPAVRYTQQ